MLIRSVSFDKMLMSSIYMYWSKGLEGDDGNDSFGFHNITHNVLVAGQHRSAIMSLATRCK